MKKCLASLGVVCLLFAVAGPAGAADGPKPLVVLSLSGYDSVLCDPGELGGVAKASELPTWLSSMLKLFAEGRDASGIDPARPWGAVVQLADGLSAFGFIPVTDAEELSWELSSHIESRTEVGADVYKVVGTEPGKQLYAKDGGRWLFVSDCPETLATVPYDPTRLLHGLDKQYDVALRFELKNVPAEEGEKILAMLDRTIGQELRQRTSDETVEIIGRAANVLDQATLGWSEHASKSD